MTTLSSWDFGSRGVAEAAVVALQGLCLSELMFAIPDPNGLADPEIRQLAQRQLPFEYQLARNARICDCMRRGRPQTGRAWCCGLHGRTLKSRRSQRYVGGEHGHDQGRVRTTKLLGEKHAPNVLRSFVLLGIMVNPRHSLFGTGGGHRHTAADGCTLWARVWACAPSGTPRSTCQSPSRPSC